MQRRHFLAYLCGLPAAGYALVSLTGCGDGRAQPSAVLARKDNSAGKVQSFGYYEGLSPDETRDPGRTDGTTYNMPCITPEEIAAGVDKEYIFWHGHDGMDHKFTVTADDFKKLATGHDIEIFTSVVEDHRHSLKISPTSPCEAQTCR